MTSKVKKTLAVDGKNYTYYSLKEAKKLGLKNIDQLPKSIKVLLENLLRHEGGTSVTWKDVEAIDSWVTTKGKSEHEIAFFPARVIMQDFTGVPAVVDLAAMREAMKKIGGDPKKINPLTPVDLVIDHSVMVDHFGEKDSYTKNVDLEYKRNKERYDFLKWGQGAFKNFRVVPPGTGIVHQVNLEYLAKVVWTKNENNENIAYPDTVVGTDSHTTMINGLAVLGWGVGGIEAEAAMLGQSVTMLIPEVVGFKLTGKLNEGVTATDLVLTCVQMLRKKSVVGKFVEFYGDGVAEISLADRATVANMAPEYGATCGFFATDEKTIEYLKLSGRDEHTCKLVEQYSKEQGLWFSAKDPAPVFTDTLELDISTVVPSIAGPKRPQDRVVLTSAKEAFQKELATTFKSETVREAAVAGANYSVKDGDVVIAAITSCTNTSNPSVLVAAGLVAKKAREKGLTVKPWVKPSLAPGSKVVTDYLVESGLQKYLDELKFNLVGYGCTTCIGNSGPLPTEISNAIKAKDLVAVSVLSGNRNFEGRVNPDVKANYLASPPLVVAYAIAGTMLHDLTKDSLGKGSDGKDVYLKDIWPKNSEVEAVLNKHITAQMYAKRYSSVFEGDSHWRAIPSSNSEFYKWDAASTYIKNPPFFDHIDKGETVGFEVNNARLLGLFGDSITTDHISPAGDISTKGPAAKYLMDRSVTKEDFNSFGARRGNHEVMMRGTFANIRIQNEMIMGTTGGNTKFLGASSNDGEVMSIFDASMKYQEQNIPLVVVGGKEYGTGSSRDWAAKGTMLLGVKAVITESFERIHRSNLIGMGVIPMEFINGESRKTLGLTGTEVVTIKSIGALKTKMNFDVEFKKADGSSVKTKVLCRIDTEDEMNYFKNGGIMNFVLRRLKG